MRLLLVLALALATLAGCTDSGGGPALATALDAQRHADGPAHKWAEDAQLMSASASEGDDEARAALKEDLQETREQIRKARGQGAIPDAAIEDLEDVLAVYDLMASTHDGKVGDGKASVWFFGYVAASHPGEVFAVAVHKGAAVYKNADGEGADEFTSNDDEPLGNWSIDSDVAAAAAGVSSADYADLCTQANVIATLSLQGMRGDAVWSVSVFANGEEDGFAQVAIDAVEGTVIEDVLQGPGPNVPDVLAQEGDYDSAAFTGAADATIVHGFDVLQAGHTQLAFHIRASLPATQGGRVSVIDPNGNITVLDITGQPGQLTVINSDVFDSVPTGSWGVEVHVDVAVRTAYTFAWCTDGTPDDDLEGTPASAACELLDQSGGGGGNDGGDSGDGGETLSRLGRWAPAWLP